MTQTEQDARRDLLANARTLRAAAERLPKDASARIGSERFRLLVGAFDCERAACFIYWRAEQRKAA